MISQRQELILHSLIKEYIDSANPIGSDLLKKKYRLDVSSATIRNDLQELMDKGYIAQPHTSAGRVPTEKAYKHFIEKIVTDRQGDIYHVLSESIENAHRKIEEELRLARELMNSLTERSTTLSYTRFENKDSIMEVLKIIGPSRTAHDKNMDAMKRLLEEFENF